MVIDWDTQRKLDEIREVRVKIANLKSDHDKLKAELREIIRDRKIQEDEHRAYMRRHSEERYREQQATKTMTVATMNEAEKTPRHWNDPTEEGKSGPPESPRPPIKR